MAVTDNELTWRKVFPGPGIDVSGLSLAERMALPDWCFGNRQLIGVYVSQTGPSNYIWGISDIALPDPCCIWQLQIDSMPNPGGRGTMRFGLANTVPTSDGEMDNADEIFPYFGQPNTGPNLINVYGLEYMAFIIDARKGMVTGGKKLVVQLFARDDTNRIDCRLLVSALPDEIPAFLNPDIP